MSCLVDYDWKYFWYLCFYLINSAVGIIRVSYDINICIANDINICISNVINIFVRERYIIISGEGFLILMKNVV